MLGITPYLPIAYVQVEFPLYSSMTQVGISWWLYRVVIVKVCELHVSNFLESKILQVYISHLILKVS